MRLCAFGLLFIGIAGCSSVATTPVVATRPNLATAKAHASHSAFSIDGTLYTVELEQVDPSVIGAVQAYTGHKPRLLGTIAGLVSGITTPYAIAPDRHGNISVSNGYGDSSCETCTITNMRNGNTATCLRCTRLATPGRSTRSTWTGTKISTLPGVFSQDITPRITRKWRRIPTNRRVAVAQVTILRRTDHRRATPSRSRHADRRDYP